MRQASVFVVLVCLMAMIVACSKPGGDSSPETGAGSVAGSDSAQQGGQAKPEPDAPRESISIITSDSAAVYAAQVTDWEQDPYVKQLEQISGYDLQFDFLAHREYTDQLTLRFVSGELADLVRTNRIDDTPHIDAVQQGAIHDLTDLLEQYGQHILSAFPEDVWKNPKIYKDGKIYGIPLMRTHVSTRGIYYRQDWLDKLNLSVPQTLDEYLNFCKAVQTTDLNGNGEQDEYCFYGRENMGYSDNFFGSFGVYPSIWQMAGDEFVPQAILPEMKQPIAFWRDFYANGYINPTFLTTKSNDWIAGILQGKAASWIHDINAYQELWAPSLFNEPNVRLSFGRALEGPGGRQLFPKYDAIWAVYMIPVTVKDPERVVKFLDKVWGSEEAAKFFNYGIEGVNYTMENGEVKYDISGPENSSNGQFVVYNTLVNVTGKIYDTPEAFAADEQLYQFLLKSYEDARLNGMDNPALNMPVPAVFGRNPELRPAIAGGTLFLDMVAKVMTGQEKDLDAAFDDFVAEWKSRGGTEAIAEATQWHNNYYAQ